MNEIEQQRAAFVKWVSENPLHVTGSTWSAWQAAIALGRQGRGEPDTDLRERLAQAHDACLDDDHRGCRSILIEELARIDYAPQPAAPVVKESLTVAEPVKVPSDAAQRVTAFIDRRKQMRGLDQSVIAGLDGESYALLTEDLLALLARYDQPAQQDADQMDALQVAEAFNADIPVTEQEEEEWKRLEDSK